MIGTKPRLEADVVFCLDENRFPVYPGTRLFSFSFSVFWDHVFEWNPKIWTASLQYVHPTDIVLDSDLLIEEISEFASIQARTRFVYICSDGGAL